MPTLRELAIDIWTAGVAAVASEALVSQQIRVDDSLLSIVGHEFDLNSIGRILVVGCGKAGAGMAAAVESVLGDELVDRLVTGIVNVPADCVRPLRKIELVAARPAGVNEPTEAGVAGATRIRELVASMTERDLCLVLISGGGSALLPLPVEGVSLADKQAVTRRLMLGGATINELNGVRKQLSQIKGGGLARASRAGTMISLIISDVIGDPLDVIASGPTVADPGTPQAALDVLQRLVPKREQIPDAVWKHLEKAVALMPRAVLNEKCDNGHTLGGTSQSPGDGRGDGRLQPRPSLKLWDVPPEATEGLTSTSSSDNSQQEPIDPERFFNHVIGNNEVAVNAALARATELGFRGLVFGVALGGVADQQGRELAVLCRHERERCERERCEPNAVPLCILSGGEPIVRLAETSLPRKGGRNQELVLAAGQELLANAASASSAAAGIVVLSGGTDGEDGPTDAAGAVLDTETLLAAERLKLDPAPFLEINNSYAFFEQTDSLLKTGPTHTNVMDLRVAIVDVSR